MEIKPLDQTVKTLLETSFHKIPRFQRPYSWDREAVADFWDDAVASEDKDYFIGSFVEYGTKADSDLLYVVDGQQRLTTITLLLAATRNSFKQLGFDPLADSVQKLIEREDINGELRFVLDSETPYPYLQQHIQRSVAEDNPAPITPEQRGLNAAFEYLVDQIAKAHRSIDDDPTITEGRKLGVKRNKLIQIRDKVLRLQLVNVILTNDDDAYLIFETMNTRGIDLTLSDLVKNHLTRHLPPKNRNLDPAKDKWNKILALFHRLDPPIDMSRFIHHAWLSRSRYTTEKKLFKEIKKAVPKGSAAHYLNELASDAQLYSQLQSPESFPWERPERRLAGSIVILNEFHVVQPVPMMLAMLREYRKGGLTQKQATQAFQKLEDFHAQFTAITSQRTGGGTALMYALSARDLSDASSKNEKGEVLKSFVEKLRSRVPQYEEFEAAFAEVIFTSNQTRQRSLVRYLLRRIDQHFRTGTPPDYRQFSIEHLWPQKPQSGKKLPESVVGMMGNLIFVPEVLNGKLGTKSFEDKMKLIRKTDLPLDDSLRGAATWDKGAIEARTKLLAQLCHDDILSI